MAFPLLNISPSQLEFLFDADQEIKSTLTFRGCQEGVRIAFKIKTTNSERFIVCPPYGIVEPKSTRFVRVYLKAPSRYEDSLKFCQDRFLVQSIEVDEHFDEKEINSDLFRSRERQEAKLKVVVSAPLAHSTVLENEIRAIADRQGVEGHRAVLRKFSELLLAKGVISQSQVALAFSAVGEIFQSMQAAAKENAEDQERAFQRFLQRGASENGRLSPLSPPAPNVPLPRHNTFHSGWLSQDYRPSNLPSRASAPMREPTPSLKQMLSSKGRPQGDDESDEPVPPRSESGLKSMMSSQSSETHIPEERRSLAHPAVSRLNLGGGNEYEEGERPAELEPDAYDAFAPSPEDPHTRVAKARSLEQAEDQSDVLQVIRSEGTRSEGTDEEALSKRSNNAPDSNHTTAGVSQPEELRSNSTGSHKEQSSKQGKRQQEPGTDSLGRYFSLKIDRLATPAIRKPGLSQGTRKLDPKFNESSQPFNTSNASSTSLNDTDEQTDGPGQEKRGVYIPSGNTKQKANLFRVQ